MTSSDRISAWCEWLSKQHWDDFWNSFIFSFFCQGNIKKSKFFCSISSKDNTSEMKSIFSQKPHFSLIPIVLPFSLCHFQPRPGPWSAVGKMTLWFPKLHGQATWVRLHSFKLSHVDWILRGWGVRVIVLPLVVTNWPLLLPLPGQDELYSDWVKVVEIYVSMPNGQVCLYKGPVRLRWISESTEISFHFLGWLH